MNKVPPGWERENNINEFTQNQVFLSGKMQLEETGVV